MNEITTDVFFDIALGKWRICVSTDTHVLSDVVTSQELAGPPEAIVAKVTALQRQFLEELAKPDLIRENP